MKGTRELRQWEGKRPGQRINLPAYAANYNYTLRTICTRAIFLSLACLTRCVCATRACAHRFNSGLMHRSREARRKCLPLLKFPRRWRLFLKFTTRARSIYRASALKTYILLSASRFNWVLIFPFSPFYRHYENIILKALSEWTNEVVCYGWKIDEWFDLSSGIMRSLIQLIVHFFFDEYRWKCETDFIQCFFDF